MPRRCFPPADPRPRRSPTDHDCGSISVVSYLMKRLAIHRPRTASLAYLALAALGTLWACDRGTDPPPTQAGQVAVDLVELPAHKPEYGFAPDLENQHPAVTAFLRHFMETCLAGDYAEYRRLVTRKTDPESRARFIKVLHALRSLTVVSITELDRPDIASQAYLVISEVEFLPNKKVSLRRRDSNQIAILVLEEDNELRMTIAPSNMQPEPDVPATSSAPVTSSPSYDEWKADGDY